MSKISNFFSRNYTALDITNAEVRLTSVKGSTIRKWATAPLPQGILGNGLIQDPHAVAIVIDTLFKDLKLAKSRVLCTLTGLPFIYGAINMPRLRSAYESGSIERAAKKELSLTEEDMYLAWQRLPAPAEQDEVGYFVAGVPKNALTSLVQSLRQAGVKPYNIDIKPLALARLCGLPEAIVISLEPRYVDIVLISNGLVRIMHSFATESQPADKIALVNEVADGLNKALNSYKRDFPQSALKSETPLFVTGKYAEDAEVMKLIESSSDRKISALESPWPKAEDFSLNTYSANLGLLLKKAGTVRPAGGYLDTEINLVNAVEVKKSQMNLLAYAAGAVVVAALVAAVYLTMNAQSSAQSKLDAQNKFASQIAAQLTAAQKNNKDLIAAKDAASSDLDAATKKLAAVQTEQVQIVKSNLDYAAEIGYLNGFLPPGGVLSSVAMDGKTITVKGTVGSAFDALNYAITLDKNANFDGAKVTSIEAETADNVIPFTVVVNQKIQ